MEAAEELKRWLFKSARRTAVARVLVRPMTPLEILTQYRLSRPGAKLRDVSLLLRQLRGRDLVYCMNPRDVCGRIYWLTVKGMRVHSLAFGPHVCSWPDRIDWNMYCYVARGKVRRHALCEVCKLWQRNPHGTSAAQIRKSLRDRSYSCNLNVVIRALKELRQKKLLASHAPEKGPYQQLYVPTQMGEAIAGQMNALVTGTAIERRP